MQSPNMGAVARERLIRVVGCFLVVLFSFQITPVLKFMAPVLSKEIELIAPSFSVETLDIRMSAKNGESLYWMAIKTKEEMSFRLQTLPAGVEVSSSTLVGHSIQHFLILYVLITCIGVGNLKTVLKRWLLGIPVWLILEMLDIPFVLVGAVYDLLYTNFSPGENCFLMVWMNMLNSGARLGLSLFAVVFLIVIDYGTTDQLSVKSSVFKGIFARKPKLPTVVSIGNDSPI